MGGNIIEKIFTVPKGRSIADKLSAIGNAANDILGVKLERQDLPTRDVPGVSTAAYVFTNNGSKISIWHNPDSDRSQIGLRVFILDGNKEADLYEAIKAALGPKFAEYKT